MAADRIESIVLLRGFAALLICVTHIALMTNIHITRLIDFLISNGQQGVNVFFVISGFILPYSLFKKKYLLKDFFFFLAKRGVRIDPPYWCTIALFFILGILPLSRLNFPSIFMHFFYLVPFIKGAEWYSNVFWTISIEFQFYILLGLFYPLLDKINANISVLCVTSLGVAFAFITVYYWGIIIFNFYGFVIGYIVFLSFIGKISQRKALTIITLFSLFLMYRVSWITGIVPFLTALFIIFYKENNRPKFLAFIGEISYSLYLIHMPVGIFFYEILRHHFKSNFLLFGICEILCICFAYVFYRLIERPSLKLSKKLSLSGT